MKNKPTYKLRSSDRPSNKSEGRNCNKLSFKLLKIMERSAFYI